MIRLDSLVSLRETVAGFKSSGLRVAVVPTMGALHEGHIRLVERARAQADRVVVTIFVNPTQFAPTEDFAAYPRDLAADCSRVAAGGADAVYAPALAAMYPPGFATRVLVDGPATAGLEDRFRPTHFAGVATIVAKLLIQVQPDIAFFGEKDFQQLRVIERLVLDLDLAVAVTGVPTVREADGLAMSSRNVYLDADERGRAPALHAALVRAAVAIERGDTTEAALDDARRAITAVGFAIDYVEARETRSLSTFEIGRPGRLLAAARLGRTRLIDNVPIA